MTVERNFARMLNRQALRKHRRLLYVLQVASIQVGPPPTLTVTLPGSRGQLSGVHYLDGYIPRVNDYVLALQTGLPDAAGGADWLVLGHSAAQEALLHKKPVFSGYSNTGQTLAAGENVIEVNTVVVDTYGAFNTGTYAYTCPIAGVYRVSGQCKNSSQIVGETQIYHNGAVAKRGAYVNSNVAQGGVVTALLVCAVGDTLQLAYWMNAAATAQDDGGTGQSLYFDVEWLSPA